jgi:PAS domain S-box-containing protein
MAMINDITDQNAALEALKESEEKYSNLFQHSNDAIFLHDLDGSIIDVNQTALDLFGYATNEILEMNVQDLHPEESLDDSKNAFKNIKRDGSVQFEALFRKKNGDVFPSEICASLYEIRGKKIIQGMVRDITDRKLAEEALRVSEERYRTITENINAGIYRNTPGPKGKFIEANPTIIELFGYDSKDDLLDIHVSDLYANPEDRNHFNAKMKSDGNVKNEELLLKRKDGSTFWASVTAVAVHDPDGDLKYYDGVIEDITEKRESEDRMRMNLKEKEVLLKEIHHRVKNNMQVVNSLLGLQSRYIDDEAALRMFQESQDRVRSMALIHEKLYGSKDLARIDFGEYIRTLANTLYRTYSADPERIRLDVEVGKVFLSIDQAVPCGLIVNELVSNALKHGFPRGRKQGGTIRISMQKHNGSEIHMIVEDDGVGLPEGFDIRETDSLGMRLITILVEDQLDGAVQLDSGEYTRFCIRFESVDEKEDEAELEERT